MTSLPVLHSARRIGSAVVALLVLLAVSVLPVRGAEAAGWPSVFHAYGRFDGVTFNDPLDQPGGNTIADISSGVTTNASGPLPSTYVAADGTDLLVRFRLQRRQGRGPGGTPARAA